jgi:hypothetical protein
VQEFTPVKVVASFPEYVQVFPLAGLVKLPEEGQEEVSSTVKEVRGITDPSWAPFV